MVQPTADPLARRFQLGLAARRRRWLGRELLGRAPEALLFGAAAALALHGTIRPPWPVTVGIALAVTALGSLAPALRRYGSTVRCAREFDRRAGTNTRVLNACELLQHHQDSAFARWAIADGCAALTEGEAAADAVSRDLRRSWRRGVGAGLLLLAGILGGLFNPLSGISDREAVLPPPAPVREAAATPRVQPRPPDRTGPRHAGRTVDEPRIARATVSRPSGRELSAPPDHRNAGVQAAAATQHPGTPDGETPPESSESAAGETAAANRTDHAAEKFTPMNPVPATVRSSPAKSIGRGERSRRAGRKRSLRLNPEAAQSGAQPLLADKAPPAGRELGEKEGDGDPGNGRGGPTGEKKARGTAAMLPVQPQPDTVNGTLSPGAEIRSWESIPPAGPDRSWSRPATVAAGGVEPLNPPEIIPFAVRKEIARFGRIMKP